MQEDCRVQIHPNPMMAGVTTETIQQYLDENKQLILVILDYNSNGRFAESTEFQARLQDNLTYLAAIADTQAQAQTCSQNPPIAVMQSAPRSMPYQQPQELVTQSVMTEPSSIFFQQQQSQLAMNSGANIGFNILPGGGGGQCEEGNETFLYLKETDEEEN